MNALWPEAKELIFNESIVLMRLGQFDEAFQLLSASLENTDGLREFARNDPDLDFIRVPGVGKAMVFSEQ